MSRQEREKSSIINIRYFHNWVKLSIISESTDYIRDTYNRNNISLLDLAVGRGGDMHKWLKSDIMNVTGFDIDEPSIKGKNGAIHRYKKLRNQLRNKNKQIPKYEFYVVDLSDKLNIPYVNKRINNRKYDIVSCQFAIHYFFRTEDTLDTFIDLVANNIKKDGFFVGTTMDGDEIINKLDSRNKISNTIYEINSTPSTYNNELYNRKYIVQLGERDEDHYFSKQASTEYIVSIDLLKDICEKKGLIFVGITRFGEWYERYTETDPKYKLSKDEEEFSFLNFSFVFTKK